MFPRGKRAILFRDDVRNIIAVRGADLDWSYIERWCAAHGTTTLLGEIRDSIPPV